MTSRRGGLRAGEGAKLAGRSSDTVFSHSVVGGVAGDWSGGPRLPATPPTRPTAFGIAAWRRGARGGVGAGRLTRAPSVTAATSRAGARPSKPCRGSAPPPQGRGREQVDRKGLGPCLCMQKIQGRHRRQRIPAGPPGAICRGVRPARASSSAGRQRSGPHSGQGPARGSVCLNFDVLSHQWTMFSDMNSEVIQFDT